MSQETMATGGVAAAAVAAGSVSGHGQPNDVQKYRSKIHDLQKQLNIRDKEILMRQAKLKESHEIELQLLR